jgi:hypothetical protein
MWDDEQIDAAIDETARQMTAGEPGADFRVRVMARIGVGSRLSVGAFAIRWWRPALAGLSVAALIVIALVVSRDRKSPQRPPQSAPAPVVRLKPDPTYENTVRLPPSPLRGYDGPRKPDPTYSVVAQGFSPAIADLEPLMTDPLELDSIAVGALAPDDSIHIEPLPLASPIAVTPLDVDNQGDRR